MAAPSTIDRAALAESCRRSLIALRRIVENPALIDEQMVMIETALERTAFAYHAWVKPTGEG